MKRFIVIENVKEVLLISGVSIKHIKDDIEGCERRLADLALTDYDLGPAVGWYQYILEVHQSQLEAAGLTDNDVYAKIIKKVALMKNQYR